MLMGLTMLVHKTGALRLDDTSLNLIVTYKESWPETSAATGSRLRRDLGEVAPRIDHISSRSVPGQDARDIITPLSGCR